jgi:hypothetical protein
MALQLFGHLQLFQFLNPILSRQNSLDGGSACRKAATYTQNKSTQTSMLRVRFELTIQVFQQAKTIHALDGAATGICHIIN